MADEMDVVENLEAMEDSGSTSSGESSGAAEAESGQEDMMEEEAENGGEGEEKEKATNPAFSKFMQGFWDLTSVDVPVRCVVVALGSPVVHAAVGNRLRVSTDLLRRAHLCRVNHTQAS